MKKHKSVVAILLAVMMIFTMMPMMAFAADQGTGTWNYPDYTSVSVTSGGVATAYTNVKKTWNPSSGLVTAALDWSTYSTQGPAESKDYWDLSKAEIKAFANYTYADFTRAFPKNADGEYKVENGALTFSKPDNATATATTPTTIDVTDLTWGTVEVTATGFDPESFEDQEVTLTAKVKVAGNTAAAKAENQERFVGSIPSKKIKVAKRTGTASDVVVAIDDLTNGAVVVENKAAKSDAAAMYTGAAHTLVANEVPGMTVSYKQFNTEKNAFEDVTAVSATDAGSYDAIVIVKDSKGVQQANIAVSFTIAKASAPTFMFDDDPAPCGYEGCEYAFAKGETYDPMDFVIVKPAQKKVVNPADKAENAANKKAVAANEKELLAYFKDYVAFNTTTKKANPNVDIVTYAVNDELTAAQKKELKEKYKALVNNFNLAADGADIDSDSTTVYTAATAKDFEVTFTKAITKKTFKAKKNKLPKTKSFTVKAEAANGEAVAYKLVNVETSKIKIDKATGKVTLKKGLKKGTYKIKVKAYLPGYPASVGAYEFQTITVKIKK